MNHTRILIVYGTRFGHTEKVAHRVAEVLRDSGAQVTLQLADLMGPNLDAHAFDAVLVGASVIVGRHQHSVVQFVKRHADVLNDVPSAFFSVSGTAADPRPAERAALQAIVDQFLAHTGWHPARVELVAGAIAYRKYNPVLRLFMKWLMRRGVGPTDTSRDHELTDWAQVDRFAREFGELATERLHAPALLQTAATR